MADRANSSAITSARPSSRTTISSSAIPTPEARTTLRRCAHLKEARQPGLRDEIRFHDLRHAFGTRMAPAGALLRFIQKWMGPQRERQALLPAPRAVQVRCCGRHPSVCRRASPIVKMQTAMPMRVAITETLAEKGIHRVAASFEDLRWGPVINKPHDLGTDIFVQVWPRGFDMGVVIGVQVKTGNSYFRRPEGDTSAPDGWWYPEVTKDHFDYWTGHALPHLLILHDDQKDISYWVHITADAVEDTGKGAKILVPAENTLDAAHVDALLAIAGTARSNVPFEGTAWTGRAATVSTDQLRCAMIAPRLIATRQRAWFQETPTPEQVVAMIALGQFDTIDNLRDPGNAFLGIKPSKKIPPIVEAASSGDWRWRFTAALEERIVRDDLTSLEACVETADMPDRKVAATVALVSACIERGQYAEALTYLDAAIEPDDLAPVDNAWLHIQRARIHLERGDVTAA